MSDNWIEPARGHALLRRICFGAEYEDSGRALYLCPYALDSHALATNGRILLLLTNLGEGLPPIPPTNLPITRKIIDPENYVRAGESTLEELAEWAGPWDCRYDQPVKTVGLAGLVFDRNLWALPLSALSAERDRYYRRNTYSIPELTVEVFADTDKALVVGEGFRLVVMGLTPGSPSAVVADEDVLRLRATP